VPPGDVPPAAAVETLLRSRRFLGLLIIAGIIGAIISALAYGFLQLSDSLQHWLYRDLPHGVGFGGTPAWWPLVPLALAGLVVGVVVRFLPGNGGEMPVNGLAGSGTTPASHLPGITIAALASVSLGPVVGPEAPLIALGGGLAAFMLRSAKRGSPKQAIAIIAATGSFAAISTLLGSPLVGAFLLMEVVGLAGVTATAVLVPGLLGAGIGALIFTGLGQLTGKGTFSLAIPDLPPTPRPTFAAFGWSLVIGLLAAGACWLLRHGAYGLRGLVSRSVVWCTLLIGLAIAGLAIGYAEGSGHSSNDVLFSGQSALPSLLEHATTYSVGSLLLLLACKGLGYAGSLIGFRGGPTFPAMFIGAVGGLAMSHLPGLSLIPGAAMGIGAMTVGMLRLPFTAVLLTTLFLGASGITVMPLVIVAVVVSHIATIWLTPIPAESETSEAKPVNQSNPTTEPA
jgi:H+/Cl- antiporter ClcA